MGAKRRDKKNRILRSGESHGCKGLACEAPAGRQTLFQILRQHLHPDFISIEVQDMQGDASLCWISVKSKIAETCIK